MGINKNISLVVITIFIVILFISPANAGLFDWFKKTITGRAPTQDQNVSVTVTGLNNVTISIQNESLNGSAIDPAEDTNKTFRFDVWVADADGVTDINDTSVQANFTRNGEATRADALCTLSGDINSTTANYSCIIQMEYFDDAGDWNITARATDLGSTVFFTDIKTFQYNQLTALKISPFSLTFDAVQPGDFNVTSNNDPTFINNTGNFNVTTGNIQINALNLHGVTDSTAFIPIANFTVGLTTGGASPAECGGTALVNGSATGIGSSQLPRGNHSVNDNSTAQETLFYCIIHVPFDLTSQAYDSSAAGSWVISVV